MMIQQQKQPIIASTTTAPTMIIINKVVPTCGDANDRNNLVPVHDDETVLCCRKTTVNATTLTSPTQLTTQSKSNRLLTPQLVSTLTTECKQQRMERIVSWHDDHVSATAT
jgi:hypothetical protein